MNVAVARQAPLEVDWPVQFSGEEQGNLLGYATANMQLRAALGRLGVRESPTAPVALHFLYPSAYVPVPFALNVLMTMFEADLPHQLRADFVPAFERCDLIVVPSRFCADLFRPYTNKPIEVCQLGIDAENFPYRRRRWRPERGEPFRWLYVGAANRRKWTITDYVTENVLGPFGQEGLVEFYIKTTGTDTAAALGRIQALGGRLPDVEDTPEGPIYRSGWVTVDARKLPRERLASDIYHRAHAMLFLHAGEGWGLTGLEALATGLPLVVTDWSGTQEFCSRETAFPVATEVRELELEMADGFIDSDRRYRSAWPVDTSAADQIAAVMTNYTRAGIVARRGSEVARRFTWDAAARRLLAILRELV